MNRTLFAALLAGSFIGSSVMAQEFKVNEQQARQIAADRGVVKIMEIERDDGKWEIEGRDKDGREIELEIHGQTGEVVKFERD